MTATNAVTITDSAAARIAFLAAQEGDDNVFLRIAVNGGGCSGFSYEFKFDTQVASDDVMFEKADAKVAIDEISLAYLEGSEIDYLEELIGSRFEIRNPQAESSCGCGTSFSI